MAERCELSGIMALFTCGIVTRHYTYHSLSPNAQAGATSLFQCLAALSESALTTLLGVAFVDYVAGRRGECDVALTLLTLPVLLCCRALNVFPLSLVANQCRPPRQRVTCSMQTVMWFAGLRGPLSFALAVTLDDQRLPLPLDAGLVHRVMWATLVTIAASTWLMAPATAPLIGSLPSLAPASRSANGLQDALLPQPSPPSLLVEPDDAPPFRSPQRPLKSTFGETSLEAGSGGATASRIAVGASAEPYDDAPRPHSPARYNEALEPPVLLHRLFRRLDAAFLKPIFGGNGSTPP